MDKIDNLAEVICRGVSHGQDEQKATKLPELLRELLCLRFQVSEEILPITSPTGDTVLIFWHNVLAC